MPTVPQATPTVQSRPIDPGYQSAAAASLDAFGAPQGAALAQTGARIQGVSDEAGRLALKAMIEDNEREAGKLDVELSSALRSVTRGDGTQQNPGYFGLKGEAALQGYEGAQKAIREAQKKLSESAKNPRVKEIFDRVASRRIETEMDRLASHVGQERVRAADTVSEARLSEAANDAAAAWNDPKIINRSVVLAVNEIRSMAERNGWGKEVEAAKVREATSVIATGAAKAALAVEATGAAQRIFKQYEASFTPEARAQISRQIRDGSVQHSAQALRDQAIAAHPGDFAKQAEFIRQKASGKVEDAALSSISTWHSIQRASEADTERAKNKALRGEAQSRFDMIIERTTDPKERIRLARSLPPEIRDDVEARLSNEENRDRREVADLESVARRAEHLARVEEQRRALAEKEQNKLAFKTADDLVSQGGSLNSLSPEVRSLLTPEQRLAIERYEDRRSNGMEFAKSSDQNKLNEYLNMAPEELTAVTQAEMKTYLTKEDYTYVENEKRAAAKGERDPKSPYSLQSRVANQTVSLLGVADTNAERGRHKRIQNMVEQEIAREKRDTKKRVLPREREQEIINGVFDKVTMPGKFFGTNEVPIYDAVEKVPEKERKLIISAFKTERGTIPTELQVLQSYRELLKAEADKKAKK